MAAEPGNKYWQFRNKHGRNFKYTPEELWDEAVKYFDWMSERTWIKKEAVKGRDGAEIVDLPTSTPFSLETFCLFADIDHKTFANYESDEATYKDFFPIASRIRKIIESQQFEGATVGAYNSSIVARKLGLADKKDMEVSNKEGNPFRWEIIRNETEQ